MWRIPLAVLLCGVALAVTEPQFNNLFFALGQEGKLVDLERQSATIHGKAKYGGIRRNQKLLAMGGTDSSLAQGVIAAHFEKYGESSFRLVPDKPLSPGEYAVSRRFGMADLFCFGVD